MAVVRFLTLCTVILLGHLSYKLGHSQGPPSRVITAQSQAQAVEMEAKMLVRKSYQFPGSRVKGEYVAVRPPPVAYQVKLLDSGSDVSPLILDFFFVARADLLRFLN